MGVDLHFTHGGQAAAITLARPQARNALDTATLDALTAAFREADAAGARVIVLRGAGPAFCAGADRKAYPGYRLPEQDEAHTQQAIGIGNRVARAILGCNAVTVAQVQGAAIGGGLVLAMACDLRFAADDARLALPELTLGLPLGWGGLQRLVQLVGSTRAWEILASGRALGGQEAAAIGLCTGAAPAEALAARVDEQVERLLAIAPAALLLTKRQFRALAATAALGAIDELDGPLLLGALRQPGAADAFGLR
ncbi:enoyl-CoA hydratase/isomerase family protein [Piscinibacter sakaiensis]|uniref:Enoyl-CoA hydratase n=1 Tax=Piscinibacter sakaiensis TaxID=1547922 RepID=A0A0K8P892_PISS1|nr:enoyl-CoA hydratase/isomerase family protein [Piscinibacter sakaiensis]GAP38856.1 enoyl-CoA hydratase [Piscinibacter sakaiensis]